VPHDPVVLVLVLVLLFLLEFIFVLLRLLVLARARANADYENEQEYERDRAGPAAGGTPFAHRAAEIVIRGDPELEDRVMLPVLATLMLAAAGWALIAYLLTGSFGFAILVFIVLKVIGR
jgi:hypothetical protein